MQQTRNPDAIARSLASLLLLLTTPCTNPPMVSWYHALARSAVHFDAADGIATSRNASRNEDAEIILLSAGPRTQNVLVCPAVSH